MNARLPKDWITAPAIDLELKQYILLAYLQGVKRRFDERKLYPHLDELRQRLEELASLARTKDDMSTGLMRDLNGFDPRSGRPTFAPLEEGAWLRIIDDVIAWSLPELRHMLGSGRELFDELAGQIHFEPVGVIPLNPREGYLLLREGNEARVYSYVVPLVQGAGEGVQYLNVTTHYITTCTITLSRHYEQIKADLLRQVPDMPNPATFAFETGRALPCIETYLPIAKQLVLDHIRRGIAA